MPVQGGILCPACAATGEKYLDSDPDDSNTTISDSIATDDARADEPLTPTATDDPMHDDDLFSDADYDAFDSAGDADMNAGIRDGFDS